MEKFIAWERTQKRRQSFSAFARYLDVKQASLSQWMNGNYTPTGDNLLKVAAKLGDEVYFILGYKASGSPEEHWDVMSPRMRSAFSEWKETVISTGIEDDPDKMDRLFTKIMAKYGFNDIVTDDDESSM